MTSERRRDSGAYADEKIQVLSHAILYQKGAADAFDRLFKKFASSILIVSYSSNSLPTQDEMVAIMAKYKSHVELYLDYKYSFGNQNEAKPTGIPYRNIFLLDIDRGLSSYERTNQNMAGGQHWPAYPNRIQEGFSVFANLAFVGHLHGRDNELGFMNLLDEKGIIQNEEGKTVPAATLVNGG